MAGHCDMETVLLVEPLCHGLERCAMAGMAEGERPEDATEERGAGVMDVEVVVYHLVDHDVSEGVLVEVETVGHEDDDVALLEWQVPLANAIFETSEYSIGVRHVKLGDSQLVVEVPAVALPEHTGHSVEVCYHYQSIFSKTLQN